MSPNEKAECYLKLMEIQATHFKQTRDLEFKVNLALWSAIVVSGGFLFGKVHLNSGGSKMAFIAVALLLFVAHLALWMIPIQNSEDTDDHFIREYGRRVEALLKASVPSVGAKSPKWVWRSNSRLRKHGWSWILFESGITALLLLCVGLVLSIG